MRRDSPLATRHSVTTTIRDDDTGTHDDEDTETGATGTAAATAALATEATEATKARPCVTPRPAHTHENMKTQYY